MKLMLIGLAVMAALFALSVLVVALVMRSIK
jgi:hypothetical protein